MKHFRDPVTGRCAVCESKGLDPAILHNGIIYPNHTPRLQNEPKVIEVRSDKLGPSPQQYDGNSPRTSPGYAASNPEKPPSEAARSTTSTASASQVTFATQTSFAYDDPQTSPSPPQERRKRKNDSPRYSPDGSPSRARYSDHKIREPQVWYVGEGPSQQRPNRSPSPRRRDRSPDRKQERNPRNRTPSPYDRRREKHDYDDRGRQGRPKERDYEKNDRSYRRQKGYNKASRSKGRSCCRGCRSWCSCRKCCMIFWVTLLVLLALAALATAIYFAVAGAQNENSVQDLTILKDPRYLIYGLDQPCRTTVITTTGVTSAGVTTSGDPTTTLILCYDTTTRVVLDGSESRISAALRTTSSVYALVVFAALVKIVSAM